MTFIAGPYDMSYTPPAGDLSSLGITQDGFEVQWVNHADLIRGDNLGESIQDGVWRGGDCYIECMCEEFDAAALYGAHGNAPSAMWPGSTNFGRHGQVGRLLSGMAGMLTLTRTSALTTASPTTITAAKAILANGHVVRSKWATRLRTVPLRFLLLPYISSGNKVWFVPS